MPIYDEREPKVQRLNNRINELRKCAKVIAKYLNNIQKCIPRSSTNAIRVYEMMMEEFGGLVIMCATVPKGLEDAGGISLVLQSFESDRRINCRITQDGLNMTVIRVNEHMTGSVTLDAKLHDKEYKALADWVNGK